MSSGLFYLGVFNSFFILLVQISLVLYIFIRLVFDYYSLDLVFTNLASTLFLLGLVCGVTE
jgi:hypothetical protein